MNVQHRILNDDVASLL